MKEGRRLLLPIYILNSRTEKGLDRAIVHCAAAAPSGGVGGRRSSPAYLETFGSRGFLSSSVVVFGELGSIRIAIDAGLG